MLQNSNIAIKKTKLQASPSIYSAMIPSEATGIHYFTPENPSPFPSNFSLMHSNFPALQFNGLLTNLQNYQSPPIIHEFTPQVSCLSNNSTSDEADEQQLRIIDERKQRRMISNRESARRSRMRKQRHLDELWSQVLRLRTENHNLMDKLNHVSDSHDRVVKENTRLKEEASDLRHMLNDLQLGNLYNALGDLDEVPCNTAHLKAESSSQSISTTTNLLL